MSTTDIVEYKTINSSSFTSLDEVVNAHLHQGWELYGPPRSNQWTTPSGFLKEQYGQTIVKRKPINNQ